MERPSTFQPSALHLGATLGNRRNSPIVARRSAVDKLLRDGLPYSKKLVWHTSCVNTLAFSRDGRWLASAGDDPYVQIWDFNQEELSQPSWKFSGPQSNVFCLAFSASGQYVYSGDTSDIIYQYDISHMGSPVNRTGSTSPSWRDAQHHDSIRAISCHPEQDQLFLSAAEDGRIILHDMRANPQHTRTQRIFQHNAEFTCVEYHPTMANIFATSDNRGQVCLRDVRMAFGPLSQRREEGIIHKYVTTVAKQGVARMARPEASSLTFDSEGRRLAVTMQHHIPTLYALNDLYPIATFSGRHFRDGSPVPPGVQTYSNSCTMKHGSFGGLGSNRDMFYVEGSDDFRTYVWKVPEVSALLEGRDVVSYSEWTMNKRPGEIGYSSSLLGPRYVPVDISVPLARLTGHDSIVNTALIHPYRPYILTAGIERYIRLHSPTEASPCTEPLSLTPTEVRSITTAFPRNRRLFGTVDELMDDDDDDSQAITLFDHILRQEGHGDVFAIHPWDPDRDGESSSDDSAGSDDHNDSEDDMELF
ncbi:WD40 repeat-like protein [Fomes fomentarius]|nr:WD40 repeat-like protein [Fomes fomentarius]